MIHEIVRELGALLRQRGCPIPVCDRETTTTTTWGRERIVLEHSEGGGDSFGGVRGVHRNAKHHFTRSIALQLTIYAQATRPGSLEWEHRRRAEHILDMVLVALDDIASRRKNAWEPSSGGFIVPEDLQASERHGGAVYQLALSFDRAVLAAKWSGDIQPEVTVGGPGGVAITTTNLRVSADGGTTFEEITNG